jgi:hypothetical protein
LKHSAREILLIESLVRYLEYILLERIIQSLAKPVIPSHRRPNQIGLSVPNANQMTPERVSKVRDGIPTVILNTSSAVQGSNRLFDELHDGDTGELRRSDDRLSLSLVEVGRNRDVGFYLG